jgi:hypothetical protein
VEITSLKCGCVIGKMKMLGGGDDGVINLISYVVCLANFMDLQVGLEEEHRRTRELGFNSTWCRLHVAANDERVNT